MNQSLKTQTDSLFDIIAKLLLIRLSKLLAQPLKQSKAFMGVMLIMALMLLLRQCLVRAHLLLGSKLKLDEGLAILAVRSSCLLVKLVKP